MSFLEKILILVGTLWLTTIGFIIYMWILQTKQQLILRYIAKKLTDIEKNTQKQSTEKKETEKTKEPETRKQETVVTISKNEPMSKYETVNLPDEAEIKFVD
jgi:hypothetical protein